MKTILNENLLLGFHDVQLIYNLCLFTVVSLLHQH